MFGWFIIVDYQISRFRRVISREDDPLFILMFIKTSGNALLSW